MTEIRPLVHLVLHVLVPGAVARIAYLDRWRVVWMVMVATMVVDLDHLLADPVYDPQRCGLGFHPLHTYPAIAIYAVLTLLPSTRIVAVGLVIHMVLDGIDCVWLTW